MPRPRHVLSGLLALLSACTPPTPEPATNEPAPAPTNVTPPAPPAAPATNAPPTPPAAPATNTTPTPDTNAPPAPPAAPEPETPTLERKAHALYRAAMATGRELHRKKDYRGAIAAFEQALAIDPDDPRALAELGWAAFFVPDLELAEAKTRAALARTADPGARGAALYNLGRIAEENSDLARAIALYQQSLAARPNDTVRERLARLDAAAAAARDALTPVTLRGPFAALRDYCAGHTTSDGEALPCDPDAAPTIDVYEGLLALPRGEAPILEARVLAAPGGTTPTPDAHVQVHLALRTDAGWWISPPAAHIFNPGAFGIHASLRAHALELVQLVPGGAPELRYRFTLNIVDSDMGVNEIEDSSETAMVLCGIGPSGKPSCTGAIPQAYTAERTIFFPDQDEPGARHEDLFSVHFALTTTFAADGTMTIAGSGELPERLRPLIGTRPLAFP